MNDFIAKKREIFLVQMSLDTKRAEITKLEERALQVYCASLLHEAYTLAHSTLRCCYHHVVASAFALVHERP